MAVEDEEEEVEEEAGVMGREEDLVATGQETTGTKFWESRMNIQTTQDLYGVRLVVLYITSMIQ